ncbi:MAG: DUF5011 domain-containing protein [Cocleimonas sp.]|nr:DUF5011 domain-containing protein [Cocleimonas sp.]
MIKHFSPAISLTALVLMLSACGGSDKTGDANPSSSQHPHSLGGKSIATQQVLSRQSNSAITVITKGDKITLTYKNASISSGDQHFQFFINTDNNTSTGFQFDGEAWNDSGADYLIEDNELYKATSNGNDWDDVWHYVDDIDYTRIGDSVSVTLNKSKLQGLGSQLRVGFLLRSKAWDTEDFYPKSAQMSEFTVGIPEKDTIPPVITLKGASSMKVTLGSVFTDPGAMAVDNVDGDITENIHLYSTIDTSVLGHQFIDYSILDEAKNASRIRRKVEIVNRASTDIVVDGKTDDWTAITPVGDDNNKIYVTDSEAFLSLLIQFDSEPTNTQIFFDSDYNAATGLPLHNGAWGAAGIDYMIENTFLYKKKSNSGWSWERAGDISYIRKEGLIEVSIPKSNMSNLASTMGIGFIKRDASWNLISDLLPKAELLTYTLSKNIQVSENVRTALCNSPTTSQIFLSFEGGSFENGFEFTSVEGVKKLYSTVLKKGVYTLQVEQPDGTIKTLGEYGEFSPRIRSIDGALYFRVQTSNRSAEIYRITPDDKVVKLLAQGKSTSITRLSHVNGNDYYVSRFTKGTEKPSRLYRISYGVDGLGEKKELYDDGGNPSKEKLMVHFESNLENIEKGALYYAYTREDARIIGVVNTSGELQPVSTCQ